MPTVTLPVSPGFTRTAGDAILIKYVPRALSSSGFSLTSGTARMGLWEPLGATTDLAFYNDLYFADPAMVTEGFTTALGVTQNGITTATRSIAAIADDYTDGKGNYLWRRAAYAVPKVEMALTQYTGPGYAFRFTNTTLSMSTSDGNYRAPTINVQPDRWNYAPNGGLSEQGSYAGDAFGLTPWGWSVYGPDAVSVTLSTSIASARSGGFGLRYHLPGQSSTAGLLQGVVLDYVSAPLNVRNVASAWVRPIEGVTGSGIGIWVMDGTGAIIGTGTNTAHPDEVDGQWSRISVSYLPTAHIGNGQRIVIGILQTDLSRPVGTTATFGAGLFGDGVFGGDQTMFTFDVDEVMSEKGTALRKYFGPSDFMYGGDYQFLGGYGRMAYLEGATTKISAVKEIVKKELPDYLARNVVVNQWSVPKEAPVGFTSPPGPYTP